MVPTFESFEEAQSVYERRIAERRKELGVLQIQVGIAMAELKAARVKVQALARLVPTQQGCVVCNRTGREQVKGSDGSHYSFTCSYCLGGELFREIGAEAIG